MPFLKGPCQVGQLGVTCPNIYTHVKTTKLQIGAKSLYRVHVPRHGR
jgi:hypothetical protein